MKDKINTGFICSQCHTPIFKQKDGISTGYGIDRETNKKICFKCCGKNDKEYLNTMRVGERSYLYLVRQDGIFYVTNWPGTLKIRTGIPRKSTHNIFGKILIPRYDIWFDFRGNEFHGYQLGDNTQICHIRKIKK